MYVKEGAAGEVFGQLFLFIHSFFFAVKNLHGCIYSKLLSGTAVQSNWKTRYSEEEMHVSVGLPSSEALTLKKFSESVITELRSGGEKHGDRRN